MLALAISGWLLGMVLAQNLRVFALVPVALVSCIVTAIIGAAQGFGLEHVGLACLVLVTCLQAGFLMGAGIAAGEDRSSRKKTFSRLFSLADNQEPTSNAALIQGQGEQTASNIPSAVPKSTQAIPAPNIPVAGKSQI
jgi:hypothetical protein